MTTFVYDTMTGTAGTTLESHTGEIGATWSKHTLTATGSIVLTDANRCRSNTANAAIYTASGTPAGAEYHVSCPFRMITDINDVAGVVGRIASTAVLNGYTAYAYGGIQYYLSRIDAGVETVLGSVNETYTTGQDYGMVLDLKNATKAILIEGVSKVSSADNTYTAAGLAGLLFNLVAGTNTTGSHMDNFLAADEGTAVGRLVGGCLTNGLLLGNLACG